MLDSSSHEPLYVQLANTLREQIRMGELKPQERLDPETEIASRLAVSRGTVRQSLDLLVHEGLLNRAQGKGTFVVSRVGKVGSRIVGIIVPYLRDYFTGQILRGVEEAFHEEHYSMILNHSDSDLEKERHQIQRLIEAAARGLILFPIAEAYEFTTVRDVVPPDFPIVIIDRRIPGLTADLVAVDNRQGAYDAVVHLLSMGHRRVACITTPDRPTSVEERIRGYEQALYDEGLFPLAAIPVSGTGKPTQVETETIPVYSDQELAPVDQLLRSPERPTALFCVNDFLALGVLHHLRSQGIRVPEDIAIVGFDDIALSSYPSVSLSSVSQPKREIGQKAAEMLFEQIQGGPREKREIALPTKLIVRDSSSHFVNTNTTETSAT